MLRSLKWTAPRDTLRAKSQLHHPWVIVWLAGEPMNRVVHAQGGRSPGATDQRGQRKVIAWSGDAPIIQTAGLERRRHPWVVVLSENANGCRSDQVVDADRMGSREMRARAKHASGKTSYFQCEKNFH